MATNTTATATNHTGNGSTNSFAISFSFLANNEVDVTVAGVSKTLDTHYTISGSTVTFTSGNTPANGAAIKFQRDTNISAKKVDFTDGSVLTETDLDTNSDQVLFAQQEITDKLGGIEEGATADQTNAEIKTAYEANSDTNAFTDAEKTKLQNLDLAKLQGIETGATADQSNAEIKTAYEANSDTNAFTDAEKTKLTNIESNATADQSDSEIKTAYENNSNTNAFTDAEKTKLAGISAGAGATDFTSLTDTPANFSGAGGKTVKVNSSANALEFVDQISDVVGDSTPQLGGDLQSNGNDIDFADNDKAVFGSNGDMEIYHSGTHSVIRTASGSTGDLNIRSDNNINIGNIKNNGEDYIKCIEDGAVELYHDNVKKAETVSNGFTVTGVVEVKGDGSSNEGKLQLNCSQNSHGVKLQSPAHSAGQSYTIILPDNQIAADKFLKVKSITGSGATAVGQLEYADGGGGATGGGGEKIFHESENQMDNDYTISANHNAVVPTPLTINATLTVGSGSVVTFV